MTIAHGFVGTPMIRSAAAKLIGRILRPRRGDRRPSNVPLGVDNLWEWTRPPGTPSRRRSAFASPSAEFALRSGPPDGVACRVLLPLPVRAAQLTGCADARHHPDVETLAERIDVLCREHPSLDPLRSRFLVDPAAVAALLRPLGHAVAYDLRSAVTFWADVVPIRTFAETDIDSVGEFFFEAPNGYVLEPVTG